MRRSKSKFFEVIDLETVPNDIAITSEAWKYKKSKNEKLTDHDAGLNPVFGKICCLSSQLLEINNNGIQKLQSISLANESEYQLLDHYYSMIDNRFLFVAHNGKGFDFHFLAKRLIAHGFALPESLQLAGLKPWNIKHVDTMELMQMGSNQYMSLDELCYLFSVPTSKDEMDGSQVWDYYLKGRVEEIAKYCDKDVDRLTTIFIKMIETGVYIP